MSEELETLDHAKTLNLTKQWPYCEKNPRIDSLFNYSIVDGEKISGKGLTET